MRRWQSERIPADDPFARFAAMAQRVLVRRMIAANRRHWRKHDAALARKRAAGAPPMRSSAAWSISCNERAE